MMIDTVQHTLLSLISSTNAHLENVIICIETVEKGDISSAPILKKLKEYYMKILSQEGNIFFLNIQDVELHLIGVIVHMNSIIQITKTRVAELNEFESAGEFFEVESVVNSATTFFSPRQEPSVVTLTNWMFLFKR